MSNGLFIGDKDPIEIRVGNRKALSVYYSGDNVPQNPVLHISAKGLTTAGIAQNKGVIDLSGNGNHGTAHGGVGVVNDSEMGECFSFDGVDDYIILPTNVYSSSLSQLTVSLYVKIGSNNNASSFIINKRSQSSNYQWQLVLPDANQANLQWTLWQDSGSGSRVRKDSKLSNLELNKWYHAVITFDNTSLTYCFYLDGILADSGYLSNPINMSNDIMTIGCLSGGNYYFFKGKINEVKIFPYALTAEQVQALYRGIKKVWSNVPEGAILHLNAKGLTTAGIAQSDGVVDLSGNGNNGTAYGGVEVVNDSEMGECFSFDGVDDYIQRTGQIRYGNQYSFCFTIKPSIINPSSIAHLFDRRMSESAETGRIYINSNGKICFYMNYNQYGNCNITSNTSLRADNVYHIAISLANNHAGIYINGQLDAETTSCQISDSSTRPYRIGTNWNNSGYRYNGLISDIRIYPRALTAHEVRKLYLASRR